MEIQWSLVLFTVVAGAGAWQFAAAMIEALAKKDELPCRAESIVAFVLLVVGGCLSVTHLKHVDRILEALNHPTSGIFVEAAMIGVTCALIAVYFILLVRKSSKGALVGVGLAAAIVGVVFTFACGASYLMDARSVWCTPALPIAYGLTAAGAGCAVNLLVKAALKREGAATGFAGLLTVIGAAAGAVVSAVFVLGAGEIAAAVAGPWVVLLFVGAVLAIVCGAVAWKMPKSALVCGIAATVCAAAAAIALRVVMWLVGTPMLDFFLMPLD